MKYLCLFLTILLICPFFVFASDEKIPARVMYEVLAKQPAEAMNSLSAMAVTSDPVFDVVLTAGKKTYCLNENITIIGLVTEDNANYNASAHKNVADTIDLYLYRGASQSASLVYIANDTRVNISGVGNFTSSKLTHNSPGKYKIVASFKDYTANANAWNTSIDILISPQCVDRFLIYTDKAEYYKYLDNYITVYVEAQKYSGGEYIGVPNAEFNWSLRTSDETVISAYNNKQTDSVGKYNTTISMPSSVGKYIVEVNEFAAKSTFFIQPFEVVVSMKDSTGSSGRATYALGQTAKVQVKVRVNGTTPTSGSYNFSGEVIRKDGTLVLTIPTTEISTSTYTGSYDFSIDNTNFSTIGSYMVNITVTDGTNFVSSAAFFDRRDWKLSLDVPKDSGFLYGLTAFAGANVTLVMKANDLKTGVPITNLNDTTTVQLLTTKGEVLKTINVTYSNSSSGYIINFLMPTNVGAYVLKVTVINPTGQDTLTTEAVLKVTDIVAYAIPADKKGEIKEVFGGSEKIYIVLSAKNSTSSVTVNNMSLIEVKDEDGNITAYSYMAWDSWSNSSINDNTTGLNWGSNLSYLTESGTLAVIALDNPRKGGLYFVSVDVNEVTRASVKFTIDPYKACAAPKPENENWYRWQFAVSDPVRFEVVVTEAQHKAGKSISYFDDFACFGGTRGTEGGQGGGGGGAGGGGVSVGGGGQQSNVQGATVTVAKVINEQAQKEIPITDVNITSGVTDSTGMAYVTIRPKSGNWSGGWYQVIFKVTGADNVTTGKGFGGFEARRFYIWGYGVDANNMNQWKWNFRPNESVGIKVEMFDARGGGWWRGGGGLNGQATTEKILYHGTPGNWIWPPIEYPYPEANKNSTIIKEGKGSFILSAPSTKWKTGEYSVVIKGSNEAGEEDYGWAWFSVRLWDAWGMPVDNKTFDFRWDGFGTKEGVGMLINIHNAGNWWYWSSSEALEEAPVNISVQKVEDYSSWPPKTIDSSNYTVSSIQVSNSTQGDKLWSYTKNIPYLTNYSLMLNPTTKWPTGYHNVVLNITGINGTQETGWGWFNARAFYVNTMFVNESGAEIWRSKGGNNIYFNVTTTQKYWSPWEQWNGTGWIKVPYTNASPVNTTIQEIALWSWSESSWTPVELRYPGDLKVDSVDVNGGRTIMINRTDGKPWDAGWYSGEIVLSDTDGAIDRGWMWFVIKPFEVTVQNVPSDKWEVSSTSNVSLSITVKDSEDWSWPGTPLPGNYTIEKITDNTWEFGFSEKNVTFSPSDFTNGTFVVNLVPPDGKWSGGYHNLKIAIRNDQSQTGIGWGWFNVVPFKVQIKAINGDATNTWYASIKSRHNVTVNFSAYDPITNAPVTAKLERVGDWMGSYDFLTTDGDEYINGTENVTVYAPPGGWEQGWHWLEFEFEQNVRTGISLDVRSFVGWAWVSGTTTTGGNVSVQFWTQESWDNPTPVSVNVTKVEMQFPKAYTYTDVTENATITNPYPSGGQIDVTPPSSGWKKGWYSGILRLKDSDTGLDEVKFNFWFEVTSPEVYIYYPYTGATISDNVWLYAYVYNDPANTVKQVNFTLKNSTGGTTLIGSGTQSEWYTSEWSILWDVSQYKSGTYKVNVTAYDGSGKVVDSEETGEFEILKPGNATFTGAFYDYVTDKDGDTYYDYLLINATLNVTEGGKFWAGGSLYDQDSMWVAWGGSGYVKLEKGLRNITLKFEGSEIRRNKRNGPYNLSWLDLYGITRTSYGWDEWKWLDSRYNGACTTKAYNYTQFQKPPAELTGNFTISYKDTVGDSNYDELVIGVGVNVFKTGNYRVELSMNDGSNWIYKDTFIENLGTGTNKVINLTFTSSEVTAGNWTITWIELWRGWWDQWLDDIYPNYQFAVDYTAPPSGGGDTTPPSIVSFSPSKNYSATSEYYTTYDCSNRDISFTFSEAMQTGYSITILLSVTDITSNFTATWSSDKKTITFTKNQNFADHDYIEYSLNSPTSASNFKDTAGNSLAYYKGSFYIMSCLT